MSVLAERILEQMSGLGEVNQSTMYQRIRMMCEDDIKAECKNHQFIDRMSRVKLIEKDLARRGKGMPEQARLAYVFPYGEYQIITDSHWLIRFEAIDGFNPSLIATKPGKMVHEQDDLKRYNRLYDGFDTVLKHYSRETITETVTIDRHDLLAYEKIHKNDGNPGYPVKTATGDSWYNRKYLQFVFRFLGVDNIQAGLSAEKNGLRTLIICPENEDLTAIVTPIRVKEVNDGTK